MSGADEYEPMPVTRIFRVMFYVKYIFFFLVFFLVHYLEGLPPIGSLSVAQLWKLPLLGVLLIYNITRVYRYTSIEKSGYLMSVQSFMNPEIVINPLFSVAKAFKLLVLPLFLGFFRNVARSHASTLERVMYSLSQFICLASLPVMAGWVSPLRDMRSADNFVEDLVYFSGVMGAPHAAASYWCISILVLLFGLMTGYFRGTLSRLYNIALIAVGFVSIFMAYTRTGWLMLVVGLLFLLKPVRLTIKHVLIFLFAIAIMYGSFEYLFKTNDAFRMRMTATNMYNGNDGETIDMDGSGRIEFWDTGISNWADNDIYGLLFGIGFTQVTEDNYKETGIEVFSHNQFVDSLCQHGLIGLLLLLIFFYSIYKYIVRIDKSVEYRRLALAVFWSNAVFAFFQNQMYFDFAVIFAMILALLQCYNRACK